MTRLNYVEERDDRKGQEYSTLPCSEPENFWEQNRPVVATIHIVGGGVVRVGPLSDLVWDCEGNMCWLGDWRPT